MLNMRQPSGFGMDMALVEDMLAIEGRLDASGRTVADLCREAGLARSTWDRWRRGETEPNMRSWRSVTDAVERLITPSSDAEVLDPDAIEKKLHPGDAGTDTCATAEPRAGSSVPQPKADAA
jgi:hypothetical protein